MTLVLLAFGVCVMTLVGIFVGDGNLLFALGPPVVFAIAYTIWRLPLRWPFLVVTFLALTLENPADVPAQGLWKSPLYTAGALLLAHMNVTLPYKALLFSGLDVILVFLFAVIAWRMLVGSRIDGPPRLAPRPLRIFAAASIAGVALAWTYGSLSGGADVASSLWQVERVIYLPVLFFAFQRAFRPSDVAAFAKVLVGAACLKACVAIYVHATVSAPPGKPEMLYATTHPDSMLFAGAVCTLVALYLERRDRKHAIVAALIVPLLIAGMIANQRRIAWVEMAAGLAVVFLLTPSTKVKRTIGRVLVLVSPILLVYCVLGWNQSGGVFGPVQTIRSLVDSDTDGSTTWRDWENYDLVYTVRQNPFFGLGYGHGYIEFVKLPDVSREYALERFAPHNSILGLLAYGGIVGFTALWTMLSAGLFFGARAYRHAADPGERAALLAAVVVIVVYCVHCYGDMGLGTWVGVFTVAPALALVGQLAVTTGAWPALGSTVRLPPIKVHVPLQPVGDAS
jgi:O-antigen ligase